jgi:hypothetical protein
LLSCIDILSSLATSGPSFFRVSQCILVQFLGPSPKQQMLVVEMLLMEPLSYYCRWNCNRYNWSCLWKQTVYKPVVLLGLKELECYVLHCDLGAFFIALFPPFIFSGHFVISFMQVTDKRPSCFLLISSGSDSSYLLSASSSMTLKNVHSVIFILQLCIFAQVCKLHCDI